MPDVPAEALDHYLKQRRPERPAARPAVQRAPRPAVQPTAGQQYGGGLDYWLNFIDEQGPASQYNTMQFSDEQQAAEAERRWTQENADAQYQAQADNLVERGKQDATQQYRAGTQDMRASAAAEEKRMDLLASSPHTRMDRSGGGDRVVADVNPQRSTVAPGTGKTVELYRKDRK